MFSAESMDEAWWSRSKPRRAQAAVSIRWSEYWRKLRRDATVKNQKIPRKVWGTLPSAPPEA